MKSKISLNNRSLVIILCILLAWVLTITARFSTENECLRQRTNQLERQVEEQKHQLEELRDINESLQKDLDIVEAISDNTGLPKEVALYLYTGSRDNGIELPVVLALVQTECDFNPTMVNRNSNGTVDVGLMQINSCHSDTWQHLYDEPYTIDNVLDLEKNINLGLKLLSGHLERNGGDLTAALTAYNRGQVGMERLRRDTGSAVSSYSTLIHTRAEYWRTTLQ